MKVQIWHGICAKEGQIFGCTARVQLLCKSVQKWGNISCVTVKVQIWPGLDKWGDYIFCAVKVCIWHRSNIYCCNVKVQIWHRSVQKWGKISGCIARVQLWCNSVKVKVQIWHGSVQKWGKLYSPASPTFVRNMGKRKAFLRPSAAGKIMNWIFFNKTKNRYGLNKRQNHEL